MISKKQNLKNGFSKIGSKMSMGRVPTKIFCASEFFYRKFVKKNFCGRGPQKSTILGLFSKINVRNFCQLGKTYFLRPRFFWKVEDMGGYFWGCAPNCFFMKTCEPTWFPEKWEDSEPNSRSYRRLLYCKRFYQAQYDLIRFWI